MKNVLDMAILSVKSALLPLIALEKTVFAVIDDVYYAKDLTIPNVKNV